MLRARMRETLPLLRAQTRERVAMLRATRKPPEHPWRRRALVAALLLLALLLLHCDDEAARGPAIAAKIPLPPAATVKAPAANFQAALEHRHRPGFQSEAHPAPDWLDDFRLQVAARSPRLAQCFNGSERSGTFRWTVSVDAASGTVSDHHLELVREGAELGRDQERCVTAVLSTPAYHLTPRPASRALPDRVSLIIEF